MVPVSVLELGLFESSVDLEIKINNALQVINNNCGKVINMNYIADKSGVVQTVIIEYEV